MSEYDLDILPAACARIRPLLFVAAEGALERDERLEVQAHLAVCEACRSAERGERALTALLSESRAQPPVATPSTGPRSLLLSVAALVFVSIVLFVLPAATPESSVQHRELSTSLQWRTVDEQALADGDQLVVPATQAVSIQLGAAVALDAVGPAAFSVQRLPSGRQDSWQLSVVDGAVVVDVAAGGLCAVGHGQPLAVGSYVAVPGRVDICATGVQDPQPQDPTPTTAALLARGLERFGAATPPSLGGDEEQEQQALADAEELLREVITRPDATLFERRRALCYLAASVSRQDRSDEAYELEQEDPRRYPDGEEASAIRFWMASYLRDEGEIEQARELFEQVLEDEGAESSLGQAAQGYLFAMGAAGVPAPRLRLGAPAPAPLPDRLEVHRDAAAAMGEDQGGYLVVEVDLDAERADDRGFLDAAAAARAFHDADRLQWSGDDYEALGQTLRDRAPSAVLFVLRPEALDLPRHRQVLLQMARLDDDWFADASFGYLTARDGDGIVALWRRIEGVHQRGTLSGMWWQASVTTGDRSLEYENSPPARAAKAGFAGPHYYYAVGDADRDAAIARSLQSMARASVVEFTGCGDPQGIWLFDDHRNVRRDLHWEYEAAKVGHDPDGEMPRLLAARFLDVELDAPILWSGTCHSGAVCDVFVEADIVSTFGRTDRATVHRLEPEQSLALCWLQAGAASMLVPLGANHGMSVSMEADFALQHGASLGETIKSTYDDVLLACEGQLRLDIPVPGEPHATGEPIMQGGGCNRILIGDPALRPFSATESLAERVQVERTAEGLRVTVTRRDGWQPRAWDMFGQDRARDYRVLTRVDLTALELGDRTDFEARVEARAPGGEALGYGLSRVAVEDHGGTRYLHLQASGTRQELDRKAAVIVFEVRAR